MYTLTQEEIEEGLKGGYDTEIQISEDGDKLLVVSFDLSVVDYTEYQHYIELDHIKNYMYEALHRLSDEIDFYTEHKETHITYYYVFLLSDITEEK